MIWHIRQDTPNETRCIRHSAEGHLLPTGNVKEIKDVIWVTKNINMFHAWMSQMSL
jgi:hypothetical protein